MLTNEIQLAHGKANIHDCADLEVEYNFTFPVEIKWFYLKYNGGKLTRREVVLQEGSWVSSTSFHEFYTLKAELEHALTEIYTEDWWIPWLIPFGYDDGGEHFCFSIREKDYGCIYYFISECIDEENPENALVKVGDDFIQFLNHMR